VKLCVHFISQGVYWKAGDDVADEEVPDFVRKYAVTETSGNGEAGSPAGSKARTGSAVEAVAPTPKLRQLRKRYVKRGVAWRRVKDVAVKVGRADLYPAWTFPLSGDRSCLERWKVACRKAWRVASAILPSQPKKRLPAAYTWSRNRGISKRSHPNLTKRAKQQEVKAPKTSMERKIRHQSRAEQSKGLAKGEAGTVAG
jgi:hypothetical protein